MGERIAIKFCMPVGRAPGHQTYPKVVAKTLLPRHSVYWLPCDCGTSYASRSSIRSPANEKKLSCCWETADASTAYPTFWEWALPVDVFVHKMYAFISQLFPRYSIPNVTVSARNRHFSAPLSHLTPRCGGSP